MGKTSKLLNKRVVANNSTILDMFKAQPTKQEGPTFTMEEYNQIIAMLNEKNNNVFPNVVGKKKSSTTIYWIVDNGATDHICNIEPTNQIKTFEFVNLFDGEKLISILSQPTHRWEGDAGLTGASSMGGRRAESPPTFI